MPAAPTCPTCRSPLEDGTCPRCESTEGSLEEARKRLDQTRERLDAWRQRLSRRLEEYERKRELLESDDARTAARASTVRLPEPPPPPPGPGALAGPGVEPELPRPRAPWAREAVLEARRLQRAPTPTLLEPDEYRAMGASVSRLPEPETPLAPDPRELPTAPEPWLPTEPRAVLAPDEAAAAPVEAPPPAYPEVQLEEAREVAGEAAPALRFPARRGHVTLTRRAASLLLDLLLLWLLPLVVVTGPAAWLVLGRSVASLWVSHASLLVPFSLLLFVALLTGYTGAFGRTPGLRLTGLQVVDQAGATPSFGQALLRAAAFPVILFPGIEAASRTRTVPDP